MQKKDGMVYAPEARKTKKVVDGEEFPFAAAFFDHGHLYGQINGLLEAGAKLSLIYDTDETRLRSLKEKFPEVRIARTFEEVLQSDVSMVASAAIPSERARIGIEVMKAGKDYFVDKCPFASIDQLESARATVEQTGQKYLVYYSERLHVESAWYADELIQGGAIGDIVHMEIFGPHRLSKDNRPVWFFEKTRYGGILTDIASHQFDQFLHYARCDEGEVVHAVVDNRSHPDRPEFEDVGQASLILANGVQCFSRVNWYTPDGMRGWGDGRTFITGTKGVMEIRKYFDLGRGDQGDLIFLVDGSGEQVLDVGGKVGFPFFGEMILDCLNRTEKAMTQHHAFQAARLSLEAQALADEARR
ncbi:MAG: Gfo/Idh/MocA family oxidoreductase [Verrucomicrobiota bacterium]